jgi:hypothetical protein
MVGAVCQDDLLQGCLDRALSEGERHPFPKRGKSVRGSVAMVALATGHG